MSGAAEDTAIITVTATATVEVLGHCEMALRVSQWSRALYYNTGYTRFFFLRTLTTIIRLIIL